MNWRVTFYSAAFEKDVQQLPAGFVARFLRYAERMEVYGPDLGMPHTRVMGGGLFELILSDAKGQPKLEPFEAPEEAGTRADEEEDEVWQPD